MDKFPPFEEKNQLIKRKSSAYCRRGEKRNGKGKNNNRCDSFSLKNGLVGFSSAAGGNNFFGMYGLKPDVFDITKYVSERPLHELLCGSEISPCNSKEKGKKGTSPANDILQSVRNMCSVLQAKRILQVRNCAEIDNSGTCRVSTSFVTVSAVGQTDEGKGCNYNADLPSPNKVLESDEKVKISTAAESPLYTPKEILERLALPPPKDLDLLLSDASKTTSSKSNIDPRLGKQVLQRAGLPPFTWSNSFSGHSKLGSDTAKITANRAICQGRWVKVESSPALQKGLGNLLVDFESLAFDHNLVPSANLTSEQENKFASSEWDLSTFACSLSGVPTDDSSPTIAAAQTLVDMAAYFKENPCPVEKLSNKPPQFTMKASKSKAIKRSNFFDPPNTSIQPPNSFRVADYGFSSKKLRLSSDVTNTYVGHTDTMRKGKSHQSPIISYKSPPRKLSRDSNSNTEDYNNNHVKKACVMKTPRSIDRPSGAKSKLWKPSQ